MKIVVNTDNYEILNSIIRAAKGRGDEIVIAKLEKKLFDLIEYPENEAYVLGNNKLYSQKAVDFIKKNSQYTPVIILGLTSKEIKAADILIPVSSALDSEILAPAILHNIYTYVKNFEVLQRLTAKLDDPIEFGDCRYDPQKRVLFYKNVPVKVNGKDTGKLSPKQGSILELLAQNFGKTVQKDLILEKAWGSANYFIGRSFDVFITHLRNIFKENKMNLTLTNVANVGLLLDSSE
jgi:DNA-binding response OmpR family regulator